MMQPVCMICGQPDCQGAVLMPRKENDVEVMEIRVGTSKPLEAHQDHWLDLGGEGGSA